MLKQYSCCMTPYGFPFEITQEIAAEKNITIDKDGYEKLMMNQKESARNKKHLQTKFHQVRLDSFYRFHWI